MPGILPHLLCAALYAGLAALLYRDLARSDGSSERRVWLRFALLLPLALHTWLVYRAVFSEGGMFLGVGTSLSVIIWLTVLIYWIGSFYYQLEGLQVLILGTAAVLVLMPVWLPSMHPLKHTELPAFRVHLVISLLAYSLFMIASVQALMMAALERRLHAGTLPRFLRSLPPLLSMEQLLFRIVAAGFLLLTLSLGSGMIFSEELFGRPLKFEHKIVIGIAAWCIFGALLAGRRIYGWRGRLALRWTLAGFVALLLAYVGSKFVLEVILGR
jgi:ABC-type uncharacterized transport system permease subunit